MTVPNIALSRSRSSATCNSLEVFLFLSKQTSMPAPATFSSLDNLYSNAVLLFVTLNSSINLLNEKYRTVVLPYHHHHHIALVARISLTLARHSSLSFIALGRSSGQHPVSSHSCWMYVRAGRPTFARPCVGIHKSTSLMSSSLLLQQCPACLVRLTWIDFVIGCRWPYS